jgi:putative transposase
VTFVSQNRECLFGAIVNGKGVLNDAGKILGEWWLELAHKFPSVELDVFITMPNHFHGILFITERDFVGADLRVCPGEEEGAHARGAHAGAPLRVRPGEISGDHTESPQRKGTSLSEIIQWYKTMTTNAYIRGVKQSGWTPFTGKLWQRNYYEHIVRNEADLDRIRQNILTNPIHWELDVENPVRTARTV